MIDLTLDEIRRRRWTRVGVIALGDPIVYTRPLDARGIAYEILAPEDREPLNAAMFRVMEGREDAADQRHARAAVEGLRRRGVSGVILGCTELPLLLREHGEGPDLLNPVAAPRRGGRPARARVGAPEPAKPSGPAGRSAYEGACSGVVALQARVPAVEEGARLPATLARQENPP